MLTLFLLLMLLVASKSSRQASINTDPQDLAGRTCPISGWPPDRRQDNGKVASASELQSSRAPESATSDNRK